MRQLIRFLLRTSILGWLCLTAPSGQAADIYRTVDAKGNVVFSDQASDDAEEVELAEPTIYQPPATLPSSRDPDAAPAESIEHTYTSLAITSPENDETIRENSGDLQIAFSVTPALRRSHSVQLLMDGVTWQTSKSPADMHLANIDRGIHSIQLVIVDDKSDEILLSSDSVRITMLRAIARRR